MRRTATVMGVVALLLAAAGLLAVVSYAMAQRSREFAIRSALGARVVMLLASVFPASRAARMDPVQKPDNDPRLTSIDTHL